MNKLIPNIIHLIWFGEDMPKQYQRNIIKWRELNPHFIVKLWSCSKTMVSDKFLRLERFCAKQKISLEDINVENILNKDLIQFELGNQKWARASDVTRYAVLFRDGGYYFDTDLEPHTALDLHQEAPTSGTYQYIDSGDSEQRLNIYFMASIPEHPLFKASLDYMNEIHQLVLVTDYKLWVNTRDERILPMVTADLSGSALQRVFLGAGYRGDDVRFNLKNKVTIKCDHSWLKDLVPKEDDSVLREYIKFLELRDTLFYDSIKEKEIFEKAKYQARPALTPPALMTEATTRSSELTTYGLFGKHRFEQQANLGLKLSGLVAICTLGLKIAGFFAPREKGNVIKKPNAQKFAP